MAYVYRHIRLDNNQPFYIGISNNNKSYSRAYQKRSRNKHWHNIVNNTQYKVEIILDDLSFEDACLKEIEFIKLYGRKDKNNGTLVNWTDGGQGTLGWRHKIGCWKDKKLSKETCDKISKAAKLRVKEKNPFYGKKHSETTKEKIRKSKLNSKLSDETKLKIQQGLNKSEKFLNRDLKVRIGRDNHKSKQVINLITKDIYDNLRIASEKSNINYSKLRSYCQCKVKKVQNWAYLTSVDKFKKK
jgi:hypothetical protein